MLSVMFGILSISSHWFHPTSPTQSSLVPGRAVIRKAFRSPYAMIRRAFASVLAAKGLPGIPAPVAGFSRRIAPSRPVGSPVVRMSWTRRAPPSAAGGAMSPPGGSLHGFFGVTTGSVVPPNCPQSAALKFEPSPSLAYSAPSGPKRSVPAEWLGNCWHQSSTRACSPGLIVLPVTASRARRLLATQPSVVGPGGGGHGSPQRGAGARLAGVWWYVYSTDREPGGFPAPKGGWG